MPQALLPMIPDGATQVSDLISVVRQDEQWTFGVSKNSVLRSVAKYRQEGIEGFYTRIRSSSVWRQAAND